MTFISCEAAGNFFHRTKLIHHHLTIIVVCHIDKVFMKIYIKTFLRKVFFIAVLTIYIINLWGDNLMIIVLLLHLDLIYT